MIIKPHKSENINSSELVAYIKKALGAFYLLAFMAIALTLWTPNFFSLNNLTNVALQVSVLSIVALGMTIVILTEGIELSLGPVLGLCGVSAGLLVLAGYPLIIAILVSMCIGALFGVLNGAPF